MHEYGTAIIKQNGPDFLLDVQDLQVHFSTAAVRSRSAQHTVRAVDGISFRVEKGRTLGIVGESGSGKSTTALAVFQLIKATGGNVYFDGTDLTVASRGQLQTARRQMQMVYQDPYSSLDPRMTVGQLIEEPMRVQRVASQRERIRRVDEVLTQVGMNAADRHRYPHQFSGGQRQRIAIARALVLRPQLVLLDEPVSALDVSVQAQILNLLTDLQEELGLTYVFVSHDLSVVEHIADDVVVMYLGKIVEQGPTEEVLNRPRHPYTQALISAVPGQRKNSHGQQRIKLAGDPPSPTDVPSGCRFRTRCWLAQERCAGEEPSLSSAGVRGSVACYFPLSVESLTLSNGKQDPDQQAGQSGAERASSTLP